ncbi:hypothetical protein SKAU_G00318980 [Synaphobranchus kaupii]|uniref:Uncharacterized protein n=1 Tax=Synaphobranchus kaupii TaxID=118154 RepID=A0A9Q1IIN6_SYNKA|nr:hypothetical protein SKAU_G00318980 [Synaphobranchus kaupii]
MYFGNPCQNSVLSTLVRAAMPSHDVKPFLPFPLDSASIGFLPNLSALHKISNSKNNESLRHSLLFTVISYI